MYFIEFIVKKFFKDRKPQPKSDFDPLKEETEEEEISSDNCEHMFMPIDSSGEILACSLCGMVVHKKDLKKKNIFKL